MEKRLKIVSDYNDHKIEVDVPLSNMIIDMNDNGDIMAYIDKNNFCVIPAGIYDDIDHIYDMLKTCLYRLEHNKFITYTDKLIMRHDKDGVRFLIDTLKGELPV